MTGLLSQKKEFFCCDYSLEHDEQVFGTASRVDVWLALEYTRPWGSDALAESSLPDEVKDRLSECEKAIPHSRLQLIRQHPSPPGITFYVAVATRTALYKFTLNDYGDLLNLNVPAIAACDPAYDGYRSEERLFLVCTNGKRDKACARYGLPVYEEMKKVVGDSAWQTTHLGGHRFAATAVFLPYGVTFGRITPDNLNALLGEYKRGHVHLETYRGSSLYEEMVQAAEFFLRKETGLTRLTEFTLSEVLPLEANRWRVRFVSANGTVYDVRLMRDPNGVKTFKGSADAEPKTVPQYKLDGCEIFQAS